MYFSLKKVRGCLPVIYDITPDIETTTIGREEKSERIPCKILFMNPTHGLQPYVFGAPYAYSLIPMSNDLLDAFADLGDFKGLNSVEVELPIYVDGEVQKDATGNIIKEIKEITADQFEANSVSDLIAIIKAFYAKGEKNGRPVYDEVVLNRINSITSGIAKFWKFLEDRTLTSSELIKIVAKGKPDANKGIYDADIFFWAGLLGADSGDEQEG